MQSLTNRVSDRTLERAAIAVILLAILGIAGFVFYYRWERQAVPKESAVERQAKQLEDQIRADPQNAELRIRVASVYLQSENYDAAIEQFQEALVLDVDNQSALVGLGMGYVGKGKKTEAIDTFKRVVELNKDNDPEFASLNKLLGTANYYLGKMYLENNQLDDAAQQLEAALRVEGTDADILILLGQTQQKRGDQAGAVSYFSKALSFDPAFVDAYKGLSASYRALKDENKASYADAMAAVFSGQTDGAIRKLESLTSSWKDADAFWGLGWAYETKGQNDKAATAYKKALEINPQHRLAVSGLGRVEVSK